MWLETTKDVEVATGMPVDEALRKAALLREAIRKDTTCTKDVELSPEFMEVLHALCLVLERDEETTPALLLEDSERSFRFVEAIAWPQGEPSHRADVLSRMAFLCWWNARHLGNARKEWQWCRLHDRISAFATVRETAANLLRNLTAGDGGVLYTRDSEVLLSVSELLRLQVEAEPILTYERAALLFRSLSKRRRSESRSFFLGEFALVAGTALRITANRSMADRWFQQAYKNFKSLSTSPLHLARLEYQRLALRLEAGAFDQGIERAPRCAQEFAALGATEESLKCRFLQALALRERGRVYEGIRVLQEICKEAEKLGARKLLAHGFNDLAQFFRVAGEHQRALQYARMALPLLREIDSRMALAKLRWCVGDILRDLGRKSDALVAYREALTASENVGLRSDIAAIHLVIADLLLDLGNGPEAESEIGLALPIIETERMVPEGVAALALIQESLKLHRQIDRRALRSLKVHFQDHS